MADTTYGDISPRTAGHAAKDMLKRGLPFLCIEKFGQGSPLEKNNTKTKIFRRYEALDPTPNPLTEGVTPGSKTLTKTDVTVNLTQYGDLVTTSDVVVDTHEDNVLKEGTDVLGEQAAEMIELTRFYALRAGTNVFYSNGAARDAVNTPISLARQRQITRGLKAQRARKITKVIKSDKNYGTQAVAPAFVALCHTDLEGDIRNMTGFTPTEKYGGAMTPFEGEVGKVEDVRYIVSTVFES